MDGLSKYENKIFNSYLKDLSDNAKNYTSKGGSLDKLVDVANKVLKNKNLDHSTRVAIHSNLNAAIKGKRDFYSNTTRGKIIESLRNNPFLSKLFKIAPIERAKNELNQIDLRTNKERAADMIKMFDMHKHYTNESNKILDKFYLKLNDLKLLSSIHMDSSYKQEISDLESKIKSLKEEVKYMQRQDHLISEGKKIPPLFTPETSKVRHDQLKKITGEEVEPFNPE